MITDRSPFKAAPRITRARFVQVLHDAGSPWADKAGALYDLITGNGHDPAVWLAIAGREHTFGTNTDSVLHRNDTNSWTNARSIRHPNVRGEIITDPVRRSNYVRYRSVEDSLRDGMYRVDDHDYVYYERYGPDPTIGQVLSVWTESDAVDYIAYVVARMNEWHKEEDEPMPTVRIALAAGHHNADGGGTAGEYERTGPLTREIARRARQIAGFDVRVITPQDGMGRHPGGLDDVAGQVIVWASQGWRADLFMEIHFEGNGSGNARRGCMAVYPDWQLPDGRDLDIDVRDRLGPAMSAVIERLTGLPKRGAGVLSERNSAVGAQGYRLGVFRVTAPLRSTCTRLIYEYGALTAPADKALIDNPAFTERAAQATIEALAGFYGMDVPREPEQQPKDALYLPDNPFGEIPIVAGFRGYVETMGRARNPDDWIAGALSIFGYPMDAEYPTIDGSAQEFQRCYLKWHSGAKPPWDIVLALRSEGKPEALTV